MPFQMLIQSFYSKVRPVANSLYAQYPALIYLAVISSRMHDKLAIKQLLSCVTKTLKSSSIKGIHTVIHREHTNTLALHVHLGFETVNGEKHEDPIDEMTVLAKAI